MGILGVSTLVGCVLLYWLTRCADQCNSTAAIYFIIFILIRFMDEME